MIHPDRRTLQRGQRRLCALLLAGLALSLALGLYVPAPAVWAALVLAWVPALWALTRQPWEHSCVRAGQWLRHRPPIHAKACRAAMDIIVADLDTPVPPGSLLHLWASQDPVAPRLYLWYVPIWPKRPIPLPLTPAQHEALAWAASEGQGLLDRTLYAHPIAHPYTPPGTSAHAHLAYVKRLKALLEAPGGTRPLRPYTGGETPDQARRRVLMEDHITDMHIRNAPD